MHPRFGSVNPNGYDGEIPFLLSHIRNLRLKNTLENDLLLPRIMRKDSASAAHLAKLGHPLEQANKSRFRNIWPLFYL